jgi:threonine aldolase
MRHAMAEAEVGDDVFREDPTVRALEERVAGLLGHEAGLFCPTGSLANQLGLRLHVRPGGEMLADSLAHVVRAELGAAAVFSGITSRTWSSVAGRFVAADALAMVTTGVGPYQVETQLVVSRTRTTSAVGRSSRSPRSKVRAGLEPLGVPMHLDGARLWNAHVATGVRWRHTAGCSTP